MRLLLFDGESKGRGLQRMNGKEGVAAQMNRPASWQHMLVRPQKHSANIPPSLLGGSLGKKFSLTGHSRGGDTAERGLVGKRGACRSS